MNIKHLHMNIKHSLSAFSLVVFVGLSGAAFAEPDATTKSDGIMAAVEDTAVTARVKAKLLNQKRLEGSDISVHTANGVVTLTGSAPSTDASKAAEALTRAVDGVRAVDNRIDTPPVLEKLESQAKQAADHTGRVVSDSWITTKVKSTLLADSLGNGSKVSVKTIKGTVYLSGDVDSQATLEHAVKMAEGIEGVKSVNVDAIKVK